MPNTIVPPVPLRMLNEFTYCPRLGYLEWVQGEWAENADTAEGEFVHRNVDREEKKEIVAGEEGEEQHARSIRLEDDALGLVAVIDVLELEGSVATPIDYKKGSQPDNAEGTWEADRVQLCGQALLLRNAGFTCTSGFIWYHASKRRVEVVFDADLVDLTVRKVQEFRVSAASGVMPPPLVDSPKCHRCSLNGICLPDETHLLQQLNAEAFDPTSEAPPRLPRLAAPPKDDALPLHVREQGSRVTKDGERLVIELQGTPIAKAKLIDVSQVCLYGNVQITAQAMGEIVDRGVPICHFTMGGYFRGMTTGLTHKNVEVRIKQYAAAADPSKALAIAKQFVAGKIVNTRVQLMRNRKEKAAEALDDPFGNPDGEVMPPSPEQQATDTAIEHLKYYANEARHANSLETLLGIEGMGAKVYFGEFAGMLKRGHTFSGRNRRPPTDPVNATLSFLYSMLAKECTVALQAAGLDPMLGFLHQPRYGRPSLALDLAEEFRPLIADSVAITLLNTGTLADSDFVTRAGAYTLTPAGRKALLGGWERRLGTDVTHPLFGYVLCYRRVIAVQARLLARTLLGELPAYPPFRTR
jgi:CRISPR-associated protein Cas1